MHLSNQIIFLLFDKKSTVKSRIIIKITEKLVIVEKINT